MVFLEHRPRVLGGGVWGRDYVYYVYTLLLHSAAVEATALFIQRQVKGAIIVDHVTPPLDKMAALYRMIVRELRQ